MDAKTDERIADGPAIDITMMERCIRLSAAAVRHGELPFAALICNGGKVIVESTNQVVRSADITRHAELVAISDAQKVLGRSDLSDCTLYSTVEPCAMCSFAIRESRIRRVIFAIRSPIMGGLSKWNVLRDTELMNAMPEVFGPVPEVVAGLSRREAEKIWSFWNPLFWAVIKYRGYLGGGDGVTGSEHLPTIPGRRGLLRRLFTLHGDRTNGSGPRD